MSLIWIVEDNEKNMKLLRDVLRIRGYDTLEATTAQDALRLTRERVPDLVLMDIQLPDMSGSQALALIRADPATAKIRVFAITASVMKQDRQQTMQAGLDGFIEKPINLRSFLATVAQAVQTPPA